MTIQDVDSEFQKRVLKDMRLMEIRSKVKRGTATFADTAEYNDRASTILGDLLSGQMPSTPDGERAKLCKYMLRHLYDDTNEMCTAVQQTLDKAQGLHLAPQKAPFPTERVQAIAGSLEDKTAPMETTQRRARSSATVGRSFHDDRMKAEADFRSRAGLKCYIVRNGGAKCCEWCAAMVGRYAYGDEPGDVYRRHDNCSCTVIYENGRQRQDVWSKRSWEAPAEGAGADEPTVLTATQAAEIEAKHLPTVLTNGRKGGIIKSEGVKPMIRSIEQPIEQQHTGKGNPNAILTFDVELNNRQAQLLAQLPEFDSRVIVPKNSVNMADLSALTAKTGHEFAMFTRGQERLIIRGNSNSVNIDIEIARQLAAAGYRWSGHTHPGDSIQSMIASGGDVLVLAQFSQSTSVIYNSKGQYATFGKEE